MTEPLNYPTDADAAAELVDELERADERTPAQEDHDGVVPSPTSPQAASPDARNWALTPAEVQHELAIWQQSVLVMRMRIFDITEGKFTLQGDIRLFAMAVRQVLRCAELARSVLPGPSRTLVDQALADFETVSPDAKQLRDVLDHFDAYLRGRGRAFPAGRPADYDNGYLQVYRPVTMWTEASADGVRLYLSPKPGHPPLVLDVERDADAASALAHAVQRILAAALVND
jgi:hypothetical protein